MELIVKPTQRCNFKCTFCSSTKITESNEDILDHQYIFDFLKRFPETNTIIINGGDPLMMKPDYYYKLIDYLDENNLPANISITSNLWPFYKNPSKWLKLFLNDRVGVTTSFHYGDSRLKGDFSNFSEEDFWNVSNKMSDLVGYRPDFISVITEENEHLAIKNVELAKKMSNNLPPITTNDIKSGVECKLNYAMASGPVVWNTDKEGNLKKMGQEGKPYRLSKIYKIYVDIWKQGLTDWEFNTKQMIKRLASGSTSCPQNRKCDEGIRCLNPTTNVKTGKTTLDNKYYSCGAFSDDLDKSIDFKKEVYENKFIKPLQTDINLLSLKKSCFECSLFATCNGCRKTIKDQKAMGQEFIEEHCKEMKSLAPDILEANGFSEEEIVSKVTPYIDESK